MSNIIFLKRRLGNTLSRPFGVATGLIGVIFLFEYSHFIGYFFAVIFICTGLIFGFGKEMTELNFSENYIRQYVQILFFKFGNAEELPEVEYIIICDFNTSESYSTMSTDLCYYEISLDFGNKKRRQIALYHTKRSTRKLINLLKDELNIPIYDCTKDKIFISN